MLLPAGQECLFGKLQRDFALTLEGIHAGRRKEAIS